MSLLQPAKPPCVTVISACRLELPLNWLQFPNRTARKTANRTSSSALFSLLQCITVAAHGNKTSVPYLHSYVSDGGGRWKDVREGEALYSECAAPVSLLGVL